MNNIENNRKKFFIALLIVLLILIITFIVVNIFNIKLPKIGVVSNNELSDLVETNKSNEVAKLYQYKDDKLYEKSLITGINENEINSILEMLDNGYIKYGINESLKKLDYLIEFSDKSKNDITIGIKDNGSFIFNISADKAIEIYDIKDVKRLNNIFKINTNISDIKTLDFTKSTELPHIYINNEFEAVLYQYIWYNRYVRVWSKSNATFKGEFGNSNPINSTYSLRLSLNKDIYAKELYIFPDNLIIKYEIYDYIESTYVSAENYITSRNATRTTSGDFYLEKPDNMNKEYLYLVRIYDKLDKTIMATYYFRYNT